MLTTPNAEYNVLFEGLPAGSLRHRDHRFEWTRREFADWADGVAARHGYQVELSGIGPGDPEVGCPTQMAVFTPVTRSSRSPDCRLVVLIGVSGSGKSTFAARHFLPTEVISSDFCRGLVSDDENDQAATSDAFEVLHFIAGKRLAAGRLTVIDATNVQPECPQAAGRAGPAAPRAGGGDRSRRARAGLRRSATPRGPTGHFGPHVVRNQQSPAAPLPAGPAPRGLPPGLRPVGRRGDRGGAVSSGSRSGTTGGRARPFDIIGDVHGCCDELAELLGRARLRQVEPDGSSRAATRTAARALFLGDLVDRGPATPAVLRLVMDMVAAGTGVCVPGNHEVKLLRALQRAQRDHRRHGLAESLAQLGGRAARVLQGGGRLPRRLVSHYVLDDGKLVVAHAGLQRDAGAGLGGGPGLRPLRRDHRRDRRVRPAGPLPWAEDYRGKAMVVYGHTPVPEPDGSTGRSTSTPAASSAAS